MGKQERRPRFRKGDCWCQWCREYHHFCAIMKNGNVDQLRRALKYFTDKLWHTEFDLEVDKAILDGSWPSAVELLEASLVKAREHQAADEALEAEMIAEVTP